MLKFFVLSIALAWNGSHFVLHKGNNLIKKMSKAHNLESSNKLANGLFSDYLIADSGWFMWDDFGNGSHYQLLEEQPNTSSADTQQFGTSLPPDNSSQVFYL